MHFSGLDELCYLQSVIKAKRKLNSDSIFNRTLGNVYMGSLNDFHIMAVRSLKETELQIELFISFVINIHG